MGHASPIGGEGRVYLDESTLWPNGKYVTTHLVSRVKFLKDRPDLLKKWIAAHVELTEWINAHPAEAKAILNARIKAETTKAIPGGNSRRRMATTGHHVRPDQFLAAEIGAGRTPNRVYQGTPRLVADLRLEAAQ